MKNIELSFSLTAYSNINELSPDDQHLIKMAIDASSNAYAPYSKFSVGAAVLLDNGEIITGSNQENAAYPSGLCAERVALFYANAKYPNSEVNTIAICAKNSSGFIKYPIPPCGACRQVITETAERFKNEIRIILYGSEEIYMLNDATKLLPLHFKNENLIG